MQVCGGVETLLLDLIIFPTKCFSASVPKIANSFCICTTESGDRGEFPSACRVAAIFSFQRPGKNSSVPRSYCPIPLTFCICMVLERSWNVRLIWWLKRRNYLSSAQCEFCRNRLVVNCLSRLEAAVCNAFASGQHLVAVLFGLRLMWFGITLP